MRALIQRELDIWETPILKIMRSLEGGSFQRNRRGPPNQLPRFNFPSELAESDSDALFFKLV